MNVFQVCRYLISVVTFLWHFWNLLLVQASFSEWMCLRKCMFQCICIDSGLERPTVQWWVKARRNSRDIWGELEVYGRETQPWRDLRGWCLVHQSCTAVQYPQYCCPENYSCLNGTLWRARWQASVRGAWINNSGLLWQVWTKLDIRCLSYLDMRANTCSFASLSWLSATWKTNYK